LCDESVWCKKICIYTVPYARFRVSVEPADLWIWRCLFVVRLPMMNLAMDKRSDGRWLTK
jgi:hypothetical protein